MLSKEKVSTYKFFEGLSSEELDKILSIGSEISYKPHDIIIQEASVGLNIYLVLKGKIAVELESTHIYSSMGGECTLQH